jgi:hypothetical protein
MVQSAVSEVPRACGVTPVSRALVDEVAVPPHSVAAPEHSKDAFAVDMLTGPDTAARPDSAASLASRFSTVVSAAVVQLPPAPCEVHFEVPVLSRTPFTSPDAPPEVVLDPDATHDAVSQSTCEPAELDASSTRAAAVLPAASCSDDSATRSDTCELDSTPQPPSLALHCEEPLVVRTGAFFPAAEAPVTVPVVALLVLPSQAVSQSMFAPAELDAVASPSVSDAARTRPPSCSSTSLSTSVWL